MYNISFLVLIIIKTNFVVDKRLSITTIYTKMKLFLGLVFIVISYVFLPLTKARECRLFSITTTLQLRCGRECCGYRSAFKCFKSCVGSRCLSDYHCDGGCCSLVTGRCENCPAVATPEVNSTTVPRTTKPFRTTNPFRTTKSFETRTRTNSSICQNHDDGTCRTIHPTTSTPQRLKPGRTTVRRSSSSTSEALLGILISSMAVLFFVAVFIVYRNLSRRKRLRSNRNAVGETQNYDSPNSMGVTWPSVIYREQILSDSQLVSELGLAPNVTTNATRSAATIPHSNHDLSEIAVSLSRSNEAIPPPYSLHQERPRTPPPSYESVVNS